MFKIKASDQVLAYSQLEVDIYDFGKRKEANGTKEQQLTGVIGQNVVMQLFEQGFVDGSQGFDGGIDLVYNGKKIDVKTMGRTSEARPEYVNNFIALQDYLETDIYIFCSYNKSSNEVTICGWLDKKTFKERRTFYPKGTIRTRANSTTFETKADLYEIENYKLNDVVSIEDLKKQLKNLLK